jgi:hypothetical protein
MRSLKSTKISNLIWRSSAIARNIKSHHFKWSRERENDINSDDRQSGFHQSFPVLQMLWESDVRSLLKTENFRRNFELWIDHYKVQMLSLFSCKFDDFILYRDGVVKSDLRGLKFWWDAWPLFLAGCKYITSSLLKLNYLPLTSAHQHFVLSSNVRLSAPQLTVTNPIRGITDLKQDGGACWHCSPTSGYGIIRLEQSLLP